MVQDKTENDPTIQVTALDETRKNNGLKIEDSRLKREYKKYIKNQIEQAEKNNTENQ